MPVRTLSSLTSVAGISAPVGQACTHSPQATQVEAPIGSSKSNTIFSLWPRPAMPITSLTCTSRQARTQRLHWMQASRLTAIAGWLRSGAGVDRRAGKRPASIFWRLTIFQNSESGSCASALRRAGRRSAARPPSAARSWRGRSGSSPSCPASACGCSLRRARARPRSRPCRRGSCRPGDSRAWASSTDAAA